MRKLKFSAVSAAGAVALALLPTERALAQSQSADSGDYLDVITVTARKRDELITDIPIAITAFDAASIESLGLQNILDLTAVTPGFQYEAFAGIPGRFDNSPRFRGISVNSLAPSRQTASVFVDGIFVSNGIQGIGLEDIEQIEVIKGPQSAYFGRLTFGGAINYITKTPGNEFGGRVSATAAQYDDFGVNASVDVPLIEDRMSGRFSVSYRDKGGQFNAATTGDELGQERTKAIGGTLFITPTDNLEIKLRGYYYENDDGAPAYSFAGLNDHNCGPLAANTTDTTICGTAPINAPDLNVAVSDGLRNALNNLPALNGSNLTETGLDRESTRLSAQFTYNFPDSNLSLSGLFGHNEEEVRILRDADDSGDLAFVSFAGRSFEDDSAEIRLRGLALDERLSWSVGANIFNQEFKSNGDFIVPVLNFLDFGGSNPGLEDVKTFGIFGSLSYDVSDTVIVTLEARQQTDEVTDDGDITDNEPGTNVEFDNFLPRAIVEWDFSENGMVYASYSVGNLPGGFNAEVANLSDAQLAELRAIEPGANPEFEEEKLTNYEFGWKHTFQDGRAVTSLAVFSMTRDDQTFRRADNVTDATAATGFQQVDYFINAGESSIFGVEFEGDYQFNEMFKVEGSLAYIKSEYDVFDSGVHAEILGQQNASGKTAERFPELSGSLSGVFAGQFNANFDWFGRLDYFYLGERFADEANVTKADGGSQVNIRAGLENEQFRVELFVRNLTDDDTPTAINRFRDLSFATPLFDFGTLGYQVGLRDRRQAGIRASFNF